MIISRTPLRISFAGGGSDLKEFYKREAGAVFSTAINKYVYITVNQKFDENIRIKYSETEHVARVDEIKHPLFRETMKYTGVKTGVEITSLADVPTRGSGLGSSSSFTVGLLNALYSYSGKNADAEKLAKEACKIEIDILKEPIGMQDQYIAAYGGLRLIHFNSDENVKVEEVKIHKDTKKKFEENLMLFYTGVSRKASAVLEEQKKNTLKKDKFENLEKMRDLAFEMVDVVREGNLDMFGKLLHRGWEYKKKMALGIATPYIDSIYEKALKAGAIGGKITGAGGGGFLLLYVPIEKQGSVRNALEGLKELKFGFEPQGSKIIFIES